MSEEQRQEERIITKPVKHPGRAAQGHKLAALMKNRKEQLRQQEGTVEPAVKTSSGTNSVQSVYLYGVGTLAVLAIGVGVWYRFGRGKNGGESHKPAIHPEPQKGKVQPQISIFKMQ